MGITIKILYIITFNINNMTTKNIIITICVISL